MKRKYHFKGPKVQLSQYRISLPPKCCFYLPLPDCQCSGYSNLNLMVPNCARWNILCWLRVWYDHGFSTGIQLPL